MIKNVLKRRECGTYLATARRQLMKATVLAESSQYIHFHCDLSAPVMSTDMSQVGVAFFPLF